MTAAAPDRVWTADITYIPTWSGWLYLAVVLDAFSRRMVGWAMADHLRTELVVDALDMALWNCRPALGWCTTAIVSMWGPVVLGWPDPHSDRRERMGGTGRPRVA